MTTSYLLHDLKSETVMLLSQDKLVNVLLALYFLLFESLGHLKHCNSVITLAVF
jgi:hypothetical protein